MLKKVVLLIGLLWTIEGNATGFSQNMAVEIGVFDAAEIILSYDEHDNHYDIKAVVQTANLFNTLYPFYGEYESEGEVLKNGAIKPWEYKTKNKTRHHQRRKNVYYDDKGRAYKSVSAKDEREKTREIKDAPQSANMADLQSVFAELIHNFRLTQQCALTREIYDGKKHYKVIVKDEGIESKFFRDKMENTYQCLLYIENLKNNNDNILWDVSSDKPIKVWIGFDRIHKIPYLVEIKIDSTPLGELKVSPMTLEFK